MIDKRRVFNIMQLHIASMVAYILHPTVLSIRRHKNLCQEIFIETKYEQVIGKKNGGKKKQNFEFLFFLRVARRSSGKSFVKLAHTATGTAWAPLEIYPLFCKVATEV